MVSTLQRRGCPLHVRKTLAERQLCRHGDVSLVLLSTEKCCSRAWAEESLQGLCDAPASGQGPDGLRSEILWVRHVVKDSFWFLFQVGCFRHTAPLSYCSYQRGRIKMFGTSSYIPFAKTSIRNFLLSWQKASFLALKGLETIDQMCRLSHLERREFRGIQPSSFPAIHL